MITSRNLTTSKGRVKMLGRRKQQQKDNNCLQNLGDKDNEDNSDNSIIQTIWTGISHYTKYESSLGHKAVYNYIIPYLTMLMITSPEVSEDLENKPINPWPKCNSMAFDRMIINV